MLAQGTTTWGPQILSATTIKAGNSASTNWASFTGDYNDDAQVNLITVSRFELIVPQWIALSYVKVGDYAAANGGSNSQFMVG
jgi:hypothetical protein